MFVYVVELLPTAVRNSALGCIQQAMQMAAIATPVVVDGRKGGIFSIRDLWDCKWNANILPALRLETSLCVTKWLEWIKAKGNGDV